VNLAWTKQIIVELSAILALTNNNVLLCFERRIKTNEKQYSLADAKVSAQQQSVYEGP